jgi:hypothetical protein
LTPAGRRYREAGVFTGLVKPGVLFPLEIDLTTLR